MCALITRAEITALRWRSSKAKNSSLPRELLKITERPSEPKTEFGKVI
jgi:hypothetical protein